MHLYHSLILYAHTVKPADGCPTGDSANPAPIGAIVGGVIGGVVAVLVIIVIVIVAVMLTKSKKGNC